MKGKKNRKFSKEFFARALCQSQTLTSLRLGVTIINMLDSSRLKHSNAKMLEWELFTQLQVGPMF
jgi:hypothetical protein